MAEIEVVEVGFKALVQSVGGVKHGSADEGTRGIVVLAQDFRQGHRTRGNLVNGKVVHARGHGKAAGKEGGVRGQSKRYGSIGVAEPRGRARQGINVRSLDLTVAITAQVVSPQRVNGNENYVGLRVGGLESGRGRDQTKGEGRGPKKDGDEVKVLSPPSHVCSKSDDVPEHYTPRVPAPPKTVPVQMRVLQGIRARGGQAMRQSRFTEEQIIGVLKVAEAGMKTAKYGAMGASGGGSSTCR